MNKNEMWIAERDACDGCKTCEYFLHEYWNCQGEDAICPDYLANFIPADKEEQTWRRWNLPDGVEIRPEEVDE